jgi:hypothetical protein
VDGTITLLVVKTNHYYQDYLHLFEEGPSPQPDVTEAEMFAFLVLTLQMGHTVQGRLEDHWMKVEQLCLPILWTNNGTLKLLSHTSVSALHRQ